jgi:hypothetical protein
MRPVPDLRLSSHALARMQQRGIRAQALEALLDYGRIAHVEGGCDIVFFDKKARARLAKSGGEAVRRISADVERLTRTYAIVGANGVVITVGHRFRRIPRS